MSRHQDEELQRIFAEAREIGLDMTPPPPRPAAPTTADRTLSSFEEIQQFVDEQGREPTKGTKSMTERKLAARLTTFRMMHADDQEALRAHDRHGLLPEPPRSLEDIFADELAHSLLGNRADIFNTSALPERPDYVARRKPCGDFERFKPLFRACHQELKEKKRHFLTVAQGRYTKNNIHCGDFVLYRGMLGYVAEKGEVAENQRRELNCRLRVIFENGTESDMMMRSLFVALYKFGKLVSNIESPTLSLRPDEEPDEGPESHAPAEDTVAGTIYILRSLSNREQVQAIPNLYKIGLTAENLQARIAHAEQEPTYLMAQVEIVKSYTCCNLNLRKMENLLHRFFGMARMDITIADKHGHACHPREWFSVPLPAIEEAIDILLYGDLSQFRYEPTSGRILPKLRRPATEL